MARTVCSSLIVTSKCANARQSWSRQGPCTEHNAAAPCYIVQYGAAFCLTPAASVPSVYGYHHGSNYTKASKGVTSPCCQFVAKVNPWTATVGHLCFAFIFDILRPYNTNNPYPEGGCWLHRWAKPRSKPRSTARCVTTQWSIVYLERDIFSCNRLYKVEPFDPEGGSSGFCTLFSSE